MVPISFSRTMAMAVSESVTSDDVHHHAGTNNCGYESGLNHTRLRGDLRRGGMRWFTLAVETRQ
jgi:hypothetical protein